MKKEMRAPHDDSASLDTSVLLSFSCFTTWGFMRMEQGDSEKDRKIYRRESYLKDLVST